MMRRCPLPRFSIRCWGPIFLFGIALTRHAAGQSTGPLVVNAETAAGPYFVGQGFELRVRVVAGGLRPKIDPPRMPTARAWTTGTELRPITATGIGSIVGQENLFVVRFRVLPRKAGTLDIPAIQCSSKADPVAVDLKACRFRPYRSRGDRPTFWGASADLNSRQKPSRRWYGRVRSSISGSRLPVRQPGV